MRRRLVGIGLGVLLLLAGGWGEAGAQVVWDGPLLVAPSTPTGWGVYLIDPAKGGSIGVLSTWRGGGPLGYRVGLAEDREDNVVVYGGIDVSGRLLARSEDVPVNVDWVTGGGFGAGDGLVLSFPLGVTVGRELEAEEVWFNPYGGPRVVLDAWLGGDRGDDGADDLSLGFVVDLGVDVSFDPGWTVRFGASVGDRSSLAIGVSFRVF